MQNMIYLIFFSFLIQSCTEAVVAKCGKDTDCREGYVCDLEVYVGECIKKQIRCGTGLCASNQVCQNNVCIDPSQAMVLPKLDMMPQNPMVDMMNQSTDARVDQSHQQMPTDMSSQNLDRQMWEGLDLSQEQRNDMRVNPTGDQMLFPDFGGTPCNHTCDCNPGMACLAGVCTLQDEPVYCCEGNFCPATQRCESRTTSTTMCPSPPCQSACDCQAGFACVQGSCTFSAESVFCCTSNQCPNGLSCQNPNGTLGVCQGQATSCQTPCDCPNGLDCVNGTCIFSSSPVYCCDANFCPSGADCVNRQGEFGQCQGAICQSTCDCQAGLSCTNGRCALGADPVFCCSNANACPSGERCQNQDNSMSFCR